MLGVAGIDMLAAASEGLPLDLFFMASSCVPATHWEDAGAVLGVGEVRQLLGAAARAGAGRGDGHSGGSCRARPTCWRRCRRPWLPDVGRRPRRRAGGPRADRLRGRRIRSDHESTTVEEARARAALGCWSRCARARAPRTSTRSCPSGQRRARRIVVPGHRRHLSQRSAAPRPPGRAAQARGRRRRAAGRRGPACVVCTRPALRPRRSRRDCAGISRRSGPGRGSREFRVRTP